MRGSKSSAEAECWTWLPLNPDGVVWRSDVGPRVVRRASDLPRGLRLKMPSTDSLSATFHFRVQPSDTQCLHLSVIAY